jgi:hypothetical protein
MKNISIFVIFVLSIVCFNACTTDFKVGAPYKNVSIVIGLLAKSDTAHYIKITRGFFDEKNNNLSFAQNIDSLYYDTLNVVINEKNTAGTIINTYTLQKIDLKKEGIQKDSGIFINKPAYAYKFKASLNDANNYELKITNTKTGAIITGNTPIISNDPTKFVTPNFGVLPYAFDFSNATKATTFKYVTPQNAALIEMYMRFRWYEEDMNGVGSDRYVDIPFAQDVPSSPSTAGNIDFQNSSFLSLLNANVGAAAGGVRRWIDTPSVLFYAGGVQLKKYIDLGKAQGGITADEIQPVFTNLVGDDVYGIFDTRVLRTINGSPFTKTTTDMMINTLPYKQLNFIGLSPH